jgi:hypothetical protein
MTESIQTVTEMLKVTATNNANFLIAIADHVDNLNNYISRLETKIIDLGGSLEEECKDENM